LARPARWSGAKEERLRELHANGASVRVIAKALGVPKSVIGDAIKHLGLPRRAWRMKQEALPRASSAAPAAVGEVVAPEAVPTNGPVAAAARACARCTGPSPKWAIAATPSSSTRR
jgi:hypothetical protein